MRPKIDPYQREQTLAESYTSRWHVVLAWAEKTIEGITEEAEMINVSRLKRRQPTRKEAQAIERLARVQGSLVWNLRNEESAYSSGRPLYDLYFDEPAPTRAEGGYRRVIIRALTWIVDDIADSAYDPQWITIGKGFSARAALDNAKRWLHGYALSLNQGLASKELIYTAIEIDFYTQSERSIYL